MAMFVIYDLCNPLTPKVRYICHAVYGSKCLMSHTEDTHLMASLCSSHLNYGLICITLGI